MNHFPKRWRRPRVRYKVFSGKPGSLIHTWVLPVTSQRVWYKPWTWRLTVYPHSTHVHGTIIPQEHREHVHWVPKSKEPPHDQDT